MSLSQLQIIRSLAEALQWLEKEISWGTPVQELRHLTGRIGELYAAMITRGQMASAVNQRGYDVVSAEGQRISVKTVTSASHVSFRRSTLDLVDQVMILRINLDEGEPSIEEIENASLSDLLPKLREQADGLIYPVSRPVRTNPLIDGLTEIASCRFGQYRIAQLENGAIRLTENEREITPVLPVLRDIAREIRVDILNSVGNRKNTQSLGADIIKALG